MFYDSVSGVHRLVGPALVLGLLVLVASASPRDAIAQGTDPNAKAPLLWTDPETGQVFTKPGPGRVPFTPSGTAAERADGEPDQSVAARS